MPWYKTGTVSVTQNSNAVIGTGTAFIANSRVGDGWRGPDGRWYEVTNIASNTALSISPNYEGPTVAGGFYSIMPVQGYQKDLSDKVREILNEYGETLAALGTTGNYDILPVAKGGTGSVTLDSDVVPEGATNKYFTGSRVLQSVLTGLSTATSTVIAATDTVLAAIGKLQAQITARAVKGANSDITSLTGLTTALSVAQGGTGGTSQAAARSGLGLGSASTAAILGAVAQVGGVPTGAVFETGSNTNGRYIKFADGTLICTRFVGVHSVGPNSTQASSSYSYASAFVDPPFISINTKSSYSGYIDINIEASGATSSYYIYSMFNRHPSVTVNDITSMMIAIGRWF